MGLMWICVMLDLRRKYNISLTIRKTVIIDLVLMWAVGANSLSAISHVLIGQSTIAPTELRL